MLGLLNFNAQIHSSNEAFESEKEVDNHLEKSK